MPVLPLDHSLPVGFRPGRAVKAPHSQRVAERSPQVSEAEPVIDTEEMNRKVQEARPVNAEALELPHQSSSWGLRLKALGLTVAPIAAFMAVANLPVMAATGIGLATGLFTQYTGWDGGWFSCPAADMPSPTWGCSISRGAETIGSGVLKAVSSAAFPVLLNVGMLTVPKAYSLWKEAGRVGVFETTYNKVSGMKDREIRKLLIETLGIPKDQERDLLKHIQVNEWKKSVKEGESFNIFEAVKPLLSKIMVLQDEVQVIEKEIEALTTGKTVNLKKAQEIANTKLAPKYRELIYLKMLLTNPTLPPLGKFTSQKLSADAEPQLFYQSALNFIEGFNQPIPLPPFSTKENLEREMAQLVMRDMVAYTQYITAKVYEAEGLGEHFEKAMALRQQLQMRQMQEEMAKRRAMMEAPSSPERAPVSRKTRPVEPPRLEAPTSAGKSSRVSGIRRRIATPRSPFK